MQSPVASRSSRAIRLAALALTLALLACHTPGLSPTATPTATATPSPSPTSPPPDTGWQAVEPGVELRQMRVPVGSVEERVVLVRLDPARFRFRVLYTPGVGQRAAQWAAGQPSALLVVNGGYFTPEYRATGLLVSDGQASGVSYSGFGGMFAVRPDGQVELRWLEERPYDPGEPLSAAVQCFPMLIRPGGELGFPADGDDATPARRTVVAQDRQGRVVFLVADRGFFSLHGLARWLLASDLEVDAALNLDGGLSSGLILAAGTTPVAVDSLVPLPAVIAVERR